MALTDQNVDIGFLGLNQLPSGRQGGIGRLTNLRNGQVVHFDPTSNPQKDNIQQRNGFRSLPSTGHSAYDGADLGELDWDQPRLLHATPGNGVLAIDNGIPRVLDSNVTSDPAQDWAVYGNHRILTNKLQAEPWHTEQGVMQAPDSSWLGGVTCSAWIELADDTNVSTESVLSCHVGFKSDSGAWNSSSRLIVQGMMPGQFMVPRVVNDGVRFWVFVGCQTGEASFVIRSFLYDLNGYKISQTDTTMMFDTLCPGYWDVQRVPGTDHIMLVQPNGNDPDTDNGVLFTDLSWGGSIIVQSSVADETVNCIGPVAWATNDLDELQYLITVGLPEFGNGTLLMYQVTGQVQTHPFDFNVTFTYLPDSLVGWVVEGSDPDEPDAFCSYTLPSLTEEATGPAFDPALRSTVTRFCQWPGTGQELVRQTNSCCLVSRAFKINDDYVAVTYYQSGSGDAGTETVDVTLDPDDYFIGSPEQPIEVNIGDVSYGSAKSASPIGILSSNASTGALSIAGGDSVQAYTHPGGLLNGVTIQAGTQLVQWNIATMTALVDKFGKMTVAGCDLTDANGVWYLAAPRSSGLVYTFPATITGLVPVGAMTAGTATIGTTGAAFVFAELEGVTDTTADLFINGSVTIGSAGAYNGTASVAMVTGMGAVYPGYVSIFFAHASADASLFGVGTVQLEPAEPNVFRFFDAGPFDSILPGSNLVIAGDTQVPINNGTFEITSGASNALTVSTPISLTSQYMTAPLPTAMITLAVGQIPYQFHLETVDFDYRYMNALISYSSPLVPDNTGVYKIVQILGEHDVLTIPMSGEAIKFSALIDADPDATVTILLSDSQSPQIQPTWFVTPLGDVESAQVGKFEQGLAYSDWRREALEADLGSANPYLLQVGSVCRTDDGWQLILPYRATTVTVESATVIGGNVSSLGVAANTVGLKQFRILDEQGKALPDSDMLPGLLAAQLDGDQVCEYGINLGLEQPFIVSQGELEDGTALTPGQTYFYQAWLEATDDAGNRIFSPPSPFLQVTLTGTNNYPVIGGRLPVPFDSDGVLTPGSYGTSSRAGINICIARTCFQGGQMSTLKYKITSDLNPNAIAPVSDTNGSGFSFPSDITWNYTDQNLDGVIASSEVLYTDRGLAPRFAPPAFEQGTNGWLTRDWLVGYDGGIWFSGEQTEAEQDWFFPRFRVPTRTRPSALAGMEQYLIVFGTDSKSQLPAFAPPGPNGQLQQAIPALVRLPLSGGSFGQVQAVRGGIAYASTRGGVWIITRDLQDKWLSAEAKDLFDQVSVTDMCLDVSDRLHIQTGSGTWMVYDQVSSRWYYWIAPDGTDVNYSTVISGQAAYLSEQCVAIQDTSLWHDEILDEHLPTNWGWEAAQINFGSVRGMKLCRLIQLCGTFKGPHVLTVYISYPDQNPTVATSVQTITPSSSDPYILDCYPYIEEGSSFGLKVDVTFPDDETAENSCEFDNYSATVAVDSKPGGNRSNQQTSRTGG